MAGSEDSGRQILHPVLNGLFIAFSMYSRIPVPQAEWEGAGMGYVLCFFPTVGAVIGAAASGFCFLADRMERWHLPASARLCRYFSLEESIWTGF